MVKDLQTEKELLLQLSRGDELAFREVYNGYRGKIAAFAFLLTESPYLTEEIVQEVFMKLWIYRRKLGEITNFNAWLHTITKNLVADAMKKVAREKSTKKKAITDMVTIENNDPSGYVAFREKELLLEKAVEALSPQQQIVYKLSREQGLPNKDIAMKLHLADKTVRNHLVNAMRAIRKYFSLERG